MNGITRHKQFNISIIIGLFAYIIYLLVYLWISEKNNVSKAMVYLFSIIGIIEFIYILYSYKKRTGILFSLYTIVILLMFIFNFGQCFAWAFGIHVDGEIGSTMLFRYMKPETIDILRAQIVFLISVMLFHVANICDRYKITTVKMSDSNFKKDSNSVYYASIILSCIVIPATLYYIVMNYIQAKTHGYGSLYYGDLANNSNVVIAILQYLFIPCLIGLLIGSNYKKAVRIFVYSIFSFFLIINLLSGDRGSWFYPLLILIWMHHRYYKRIKTRQFIIYVFASFIALYIIAAIVSVRNTGISGESIINALSTTKSNAFLESLIEMGGSMGVNIIVISDKLKYPIGNSYFLALVGSITTQIPEIFGVKYVTLTRWFSQEYLHISWGAGFTMVAETVVNFGVLFGPLVFFVFGRIFRNILNTGNLNKLNSSKSVIYISIAYFFMNMIRNTMHDFMRGIFFGIFPLILMINFVKSVQVNRN